MSSSSPPSLFVFFSIYFFLSRRKHTKDTSPFPLGQCPKENISIGKVASKDNIPDILSLPLNSELFNYLRLGLGMMEHIPEILEVHGERPEGNLKYLMTMKVDEHKLKDVPILHNFHGVFPKNLSGLPLSRKVKFRIDLIPGAMPVAKSPYHLAPAKMQELSNQLKEHKDKVSYDLVLRLGELMIDDLFDQLQGLRYYSKIDVRSCYHHLRVREEDIPKTAFRMRYKHFEFTVMPFSLTNPHVVFMDLMNHVCKLYLDKFIIVFIDDILVYSKSKEEHEVHLKLILELLEKDKLFRKFSKCEFLLQEVRFLRLIINSEGIHVDPSKIEAVKNLEAPKTPTEIPSFLGLAGKANVVADVLSRKEWMKPRRPFEIVEQVGHVAYRLHLPQELVGIHDTFHMSNLKKCLADVNMHVPLEEIKIDKGLCFVEEHIKIMDQDVHR
nr:putative reverse transcriptase domain-containing protein [Tanacetum cinerariifolium]